MNFLESFDLNKQLSLYIHIPFCLSKCSYCAFYSKSNVSEDVKEQYVNKLVKEINAVVKQMDKPFYTAFIGGGNPLCLSPSQLQRICEAVCTNGRPVEFTTEMNPESISNAYFYLFEKYFTRLSMGVQSLNEKALEFLGRNASLKQTLNGIKLAKELEKITNVSFDLITCLGQEFNALEDVIKMVETYSPKHLSVYALTLEEGTPLYKAKPNLPDSDKQAEILQSIWQYLESKNYNHYEVSNFAQKGKESLHNKVYWNYRQYMGLGVASASTAIKDKQYTRYNCITDIHDYNTLPLFSTYQEEKLSFTESLEEFVLMGTRHKEGLDLNRLKDEFGKEIAFKVPGFEKINARLVPTDKGLLTADAAALTILSALS